MTDFKLQGKTLRKLILSVIRRPQNFACLSIEGFYVLVSRVRSLDGLRLLVRDDVALEV